jgi:hypothetical protein
MSPEYHREQTNKENHAISPRKMDIAGRDCYVGAPRSLHALRAFFCSPIYSQKQELVCKFTSVTTMSTKR